MDASLEAHRRDLLEMPHARPKGFQVMPTPVTNEKCAVSCGVVLLQIWMETHMSIKFNHFCHIEDAFQEVKASHKHIVTDLHT